MYGGSNPFMRSLARIISSIFENIRVPTCWRHWWWPQIKDFIKAISFWEGPLLFLQQESSSIAGGGRRVACERSPLAKLLMKKRFANQESPYGIVGCLGMSVNVFLGLFSPTAFRGGEYVTMCYIKGGEWVPALPKINIAPGHTIINLLVRKHIVSLSFFNLSSLLRVIILVWMGLWSLVPSFHRGVLAVLNYAF